MRKWYPAVLVVCAFAVSAVAYGRLPARVPVHWDIHGRANGYGSRLEGAFLMPVIMLIIAVMIPVLPKIDPRGQNYEKFRSSYDIMLGSVLSVMLLIHLLALSSALGMHVPIGRVAPAATGVLLVVLGNVMPRVRPNWMIGIRTPWTLSNDRVWERTHRVGGYLFMAAGLLLIVTTAFPLGASGVKVVIGAVLAAALGSVVYSYVAWRQETRS